MTRLSRSLHTAACAAGALVLLASTAADAGDGGAPGCTQWAELSGTDHSNSEPTDLGCTNRSNLERMVEDPHDLDRGRKLGPADGERESLAIRNYEQGKVKFVSTDNNASGLVRGSHITIAGGPVMDERTPLPISPRGPLPGPAAPTAMVYTLDKDSRRDCPADPERTFHPGRSIRYGRHPWCDLGFGEAPFAAAADRRRGRRGRPGQQGSRTFRGVRAGNRRDRHRREQRHYPRIGSSKTRAWPNISSSRWSAVWSPAPATRPDRQHG